MWPRYVELVEGLPKTPTGKINKAQLRETWRSARVVDFE
jgi:acyl-coenzyme A synthetase/AMP-(fatty) acid ligase